MFSILLHNVSNYRLSYFVTTPQKKCVLCTYITTPPISHSQPTLGSLHQFWICPTYILSIHPTMHQRNAKWFVPFYVLLHFCIGSLVFNNTLFCKIFINEKMYVIDFVTNNCFLLSYLVGTNVSNCSFKVSKDWKGRKTSVIRYDKQILRGGMGSQK